jgi:hypothetical protein
MRGMSNKTRMIKAVHRKIRKGGNEIGRKLAQDLLALPLRERLKIAVNMIFKKVIFITK